MDDFLKKLIKLPTKNDILPRCNYLFNSIEEMTSKFKSTNIRCFIKEENEKIKCNCIPLIIKAERGLFFLCKKKGKKFVDVENLIKLILEGELFIYISKNKKEESNEIINKNIINNEVENNDSHFMNKKKEIEIKNIKKFRLKIRYSMRNLDRKIKKRYKQYIEYSNDFKNGKEILFGKILNIYKDISLKINSFIYFRIIKRFISEKINLIKENKSDNINDIEQNLFYAKKIIEFKKNKIYNEDKYIKKCRILWIIKFYSKHQIKNDLDNNYYIATTSENNIVIYLFKFFSNLKNKINEK